MQRITNCILIDKDQALLLRKPSKGWWVAPGGKMEQGESVREAAKREYKEETGLSVDHLELVSIFTIVINEKDKVIDEWMMFTFKASKHAGKLFDQSPEGDLEWKRLEEIAHLPMAEGDQYIFQHAINNDKPLFGTFYYTKEWKLTSYRFD